MRAFVWRPLRIFTVRERLALRLLRMTRQEFLRALNEAGRGGGVVTSQDPPPHFVPEGLLGAGSRVAPPSTARPPNDFARPEDFR